MAPWGSVVMEARHTEETQNRSAVLLGGALQHTLKVGAVMGQSLGVKEYISIELLDLICHRVHHGRCC